MATPQLHRRWVLLGGWKTHWCPWDAAPTAHCTRMCTVASLGDSSFWFSRAVAAGVSWGAPCAHKASMAPAAAPPPCWGCPKEPHVPCLFCSAGMEPPQAPRPPQPTHPLTAAAGPGRTLGYSSLPTSPPDTTGMGFPMPLSPSLWCGVLPCQLQPSSHIL